MRAIKIICGLICFIVAGFGVLDFWLGFEVLSWFDWPLAICAIALISIGGFLIIRNRLSFSKKITIPIVLVACLSIAFTADEFIRARQVSSINVCLNNLHWIDVAKNQWAVDNNKSNGTVVTENDIRPYLKLAPNTLFPKCPRRRNLHNRKSWRKPDLLTRQNRYTS